MRAMFPVPPPLGTEAFLIPLICVCTCANGHVLPVGSEECIEPLHVVQGKKPIRTIENCKTSLALKALHRQLIELAVG